MSSDSDSKFNRRRPMDDKPKSNIVENEVRKLFKDNAHHISNTAMYKLREKYGDEELLDQIQDTFIERSREVRKRAKKFARLITERYSNQNYPLHILLKKALKYKKKYNLSDGEFEEFRRVYEQALTGREEPQHVSLSVPFTNMSRALGQGMIDADDGMKFEDKDYDTLQQVMRLYNETRATHAQVVLQSMTYTDLAQQALAGDYQRERHNPHCHVHPVIAAMFLPKIALFETHMLQANIAYIVKQRYQKQPILTSTDYELFYDLISDPTDVVCSADSAVKDLFNRAQLQSHLWNSVVSLRNGRYYDCNTTNFKLAIDNCRRSVNDNPDLMYEDDEGTVLQRLLGAFSIRPTIVATSPLYNVLSNNPMTTQHVMPRVTSMPYVTLKLPVMMQSPEYQGQVHLHDALNMSQWYVEEGNVVPRNQNIIYSRNVLIFYVPRRAHTLNIGRLVGGPQAHFNRLPRTVAGFDRLNDTQVDFSMQESLHNGDHVYDLKSVVVVEVNQAIAGPQGQGSQLITGCSACIRRDANDPYEADRIYWYNPRAAAIGNMPPMVPTTGDQVWNNNPITYISEEGGIDQEDFYTKASRRGTIFIYKQQGDSTLQQLIAY
jgi:hypothetical protein